MLTGRQVLMAPAGTPYDGTANKWQTVGWVANDGLDLDTIPAEQWHQANPPITRHASFTFTQSRAGSRLTRRLIFGIYRAPGDKPLIHKGKKPGHKEARK